MDYWENDLEPPKSLVEKNAGRQPENTQQKLRKMFGQKETKQARHEV